MGTGYTRNDTGNNIADGNVINASDLDGEFDAVESAFNSSSGHTHDGTSAEGAPITKLGPVQDLVVSASAVTPKTDNTLDLGSTSLEFKDAFFDGTVNADGLTVVGAADVTGDLDVDNININGNAITSTDTNGNIALTPNGTGDVQLDADTVRVGDSNADVTITTNGTGDLTLNTNSGTDSGSIVIADAANGNIALTPNGTGEVDISKVDIDSGSIDGVTIGTNSAATEVQIDNININGNAITSTDSNGNITLTPNGTGEVNLLDGDKLTLGTGSDLTIFHDATDTILENKTGDFILRTQSTGSLKIQDTSANAIATFIDNGAVQLSHNNSTKFATSSTGVDITGGLTATDSCTITVDDNADTLVLKCTDADAVVGPVLVLQRDSGSPADNDALGFINFTGDDDGGTQTAFATIAVNALDVTAGTLDGEFKLSTIVNNNLRSRMVMGSSETAFNEDSVDLDFRVESNGNANMLFVDGGNDKVAIGTGTAVGTLTTECAAGDSNFALTAYHPTSTSTRNIAKFQSNVGSTQADVLTIACDGDVTTSGGVSAAGEITSTGSSISQNSNSIRTAIGNDGGNGTFGTSTNHSLKFFTNNTNVATLTSGGDFTVNSGQVQIGTSEATLFNAEGTNAGLTVAGSDTSTTTIGNGGAAINIVQTNGTAGNTSGLHFSRQDTDGAPNYSGAAIVAQFPDTQATGQYPKGLLAFNTSTTANAAPSEKMRLDSSGQLRVNTTGAFNSVTSITPVVHVDINSSISAPNGGVAVGGIGSGEVAFAAMAGSSVDYYGAIFHNSGATNVGNIFVTTASTTYNTSSDYRLKQGVEDMTGAIDRVKALAPKRFQFIIDPDKTVDGFLAHEAQTVVPEAVTGTKDEVRVWVEPEVDDDGNIISGEALPDGVSAGDNKLDSDGNTIPVIQGIDHSKLVPLLTGALREAIAKIEALETQNTTQATQIADLVSRVTALEAE